MQPFAVLTCIPHCITVGEAVSWTETPGAYPPASYSIAYKFAGQTPQDGYQQFSILGTEAGATYTFVFPTALKPGIYSWEQQITRASDSQMAVGACGSIKLLPNLANAPTVTAAQAMLTAINAAITTLSGKVSKTVDFNGQSFTNSDIGDLQAFRVDLQAEVDRENQAIAALTGTNRNRVVGTRFLPVGRLGRTL